MAYIETQTVTIAAGQSLSPQVALGEKTLVGIVMPSSWTPAALSFQVSPDDVNFYEFYSPAWPEVTLTVATTLFVAIDPTVWRGVTNLKIRSGTPGTPVNQVSAAALTLITRTIY